ncbi:reverse transcriptase [Tanacetum coccineum]
MERGFMSQKGSGGGRGVKEKDLNRNKKNTSSSIGMSMDSEDTMNDDTPICVASTVQEGESFPPLSTPVITTAGNAPGKSSYANVTGKPSGKKLNFRNLFTPRNNGIDVVVFLSMDGLDAMLENGPWFIRNNPLILKKWHPDVNLLKEDVSTILVWVKLYGVTPSQGGNARRNENGYHHNTMVSI